MVTRVVPLTLRQANELVATLHRHHKPVQGHRFSIGVEQDGKLVGAAIVGRPVSRELPAYEVAEVTRLVTDGTFNACSFLYGRVARICKEMGFLRVQTYILDEEAGTTLRAAGWKYSHTTTLKHSWNNRDGRREDQPQGQKQCWVKELVVTGVKYDGRGKLEYVVG